MSGGHSPTVGRPLVPGLLCPDWALPKGVGALLTTCEGGVSAGDFASFNLGAHVGDDPAAVASNRARLRAHLPSEPAWLDQVHGCTVVNAESVTGHVRADAAVSRTPGRVCAVMTADCLPVLLCDDDATVVAAVHAGWRGLAAGIVEATVAHMAVAPSSLRAWLGPAIGPGAFEVGDDVRCALADSDEEAAQAFVAGAAPGKWMADLFMLARLRLRRLGVERVDGGGACTYSSPRQFYSYRRDARTGRFASLVWLDAH
ncbi:peptidoglycan editing factor PgeF [Thauera mechernichensis]